MNADANIREEELKKELQTGRPVEVQGYTLTESYQGNLEMALRQCMELYNKESLVPIVNSVIQELALWGSLANMRQVYFQENNLDLHDAEQLAHSEAAFQKTVNSENIQYYKHEVKRNSLYLHTRISHGEHGLRVEVFTNAEHSKPIEEKLRRLLREAMQYHNVMEYFKDNPEDQDGRGLGLALSIMMLREEKLRPELMRIGETEGVVISRLEIPFDAEFQSIRERIMRDEEILPFEKKSLIPEGIQYEAEPVTRIRCPICDQEVDEKVFFAHPLPEAIDEELVRAIKPQWESDHGACASCVALYAPDDT